MNRLFKTMLLVLMVAAFVAAFVPGAQAENQYFWAKVYKMTNASQTSPDKMTEITSGITYKVLAQNSDTAETLYSDKVNTSKTNPVTATVFNTHDRIDFWCDPTDSTYDRYVDLMVVDTSGGYAVFVEDFDPYTHTIVIDERPGVTHTGFIWFTGTTTAEVDTGVDFAYDTLIKRVTLECVTTAASSTLSVGLLSSETSGDADGLIAAASTATAAFIDPLRPTLTTGSSVTYVSTAGKMGALMGANDTGTNYGEDTGVAYRWGHIVKGADAKSLTYTSNTTASPDGYIYYEFVRLR